MDATATRVFPLLFVWLDLGWLAIFIGFLLFFKKYQALIVGLAAGVLYLIVDYGIFHLALHTRIVTGADTFWLLLWMSMSYGLTNFAWMWLLFDRDGRWKEWSLLIIAGWLAVALLSRTFGGGSAPVTTSRGTSSYHGIVALLLFIGYGVQIALNLRAAKRGARPVNLLWFLGIGIGIQLAWEGVLLIAGIRPPSLNAVVVNSLIETNMGVPYAWWIYRALNRKKEQSIGFGEGE
ncbi:MAG: hypothetical protein JXD23_12985 [Spirochaetales bacterium]|nr:hypothetical protein [Spirochaetales bacterium]